MSDVSRVRGADVVRHYGDPAMEYRAATEGVAVRDRSHRVRLLVTGRAPVSTLSGVLTGRMPAAPTVVTDGFPLKGRAEYSAVLNPKGRMIADLRAMWGPVADEEVLWLDVPVAAAEALSEHLARYLPPRLAAITDVSKDVGLLTVMGPEASLWLGRNLFELDEGEHAVDALAEGDYLVGVQEERVVRTGEVDTPAWDILASRERLEELWREMVEQEVRPVGAGVWDTLRVEAGRPAFGQDMDESRLLPEVGIVDRAVDHQKGCYTGQEVIVRIRDRGHVNRILRGLALGEGPAPVADAELFDGPDPVGHITSAAQSPRAGGGIALGYLRREVEVGSTVTVGVDGPQALVCELAPGWARR